MRKIRNFLCFFICSFHLYCPTTEEQITDRQVLLGVTRKVLSNSKHTLLCLYGHNILVRINLIPLEGITSMTKIAIKAVGTILALVISWWLVDMKNKDLIRRKYQNERYFREKYSCPKCGFHFGTRIYDNILAEGRCPNNNCKCKFTGK